MSVGIVLRDLNEAPGAQEVHQVLGVPCGADFIAGEPEAQNLHPPPLLQSPRLDLCTGALEFYKGNDAAGEEDHPVRHTILYSSLL